MKYFGIFKSASTFAVSPYEFTSKKEAIETMVAICKGITIDLCSWRVWSEDDIIVAAGYTKNNRNHNDRELVGEDRFNPCAW